MLSVLQIQVILYNTKVACPINALFDECELESSILTEKQYASLDLNLVALDVYKYYAYCHGQQQR